MTDALPLEMALAEVDSIVADLDLVIPRLTLTANYGERTSSGSKTAPAPVNIDAVSAKHELHTWLIKQSVILGEPFTPRQGSPRTIQALSWHLLGHAALIQANGYADTWNTELSRILRDCRNATNKDRTGQPRVFAGTCANCDTELYASRNEPEALCRTCGATYEVLKWQAHAQTAKNYYIGTASDLSRKLSAPQYGYQITADQIRKWALREKIVRANPQTDEHGKPIPPAYRLGDILKLNLERYTRNPINGRTA